MTRLAIWSVGEHARRNLLPAVALAQNVTLTGVLSRNAEVVADIRNTYGCRSWDTPAAMLADPQVDTIFVAGPNGVHHPQALQCLAAGKHVWCEKSLTPTLAQSSELVSLARTRGLVIAEAFMFAYHPQFAALRDLVRGGELGRIVSIRCSFGFPHLGAGNIRYSRALAGGALLDVGAYCVAAPLMLLEEDPAEFSGGVTTAPGFEIDTDGAAILRFADGASALGDWGFGRSYRNEIEIWGDMGQAIARRGFSKPPALDTAIEVTRDAESRRIEIKGGVNHFAVMMETFSRAATDAALRERLAEQALRQARVLEALH